MFNRVAYNFSKTYDLAVIGGGPGGYHLFIQDMLPLSRLLNLDLTLSALKKEEHLEELVSMSVVSPLKHFSISPTNITNSTMTSNPSA